MTISRLAGIAGTVALLATSACSSSGQTRQPASTSGPSSPAYAAHTQHRLQLSIAYAERLASATPRIRGEQPLTTRPPRNLRMPDETIGVGNLIVRSRYWTVPGYADQVYRWLRRSSAPGLRVTGYGRPSSRAEDVPGRGFVHFDPQRFPSFIDSGELYVEMEPGSAGHTVIGAFAEVVPHPVRPTSETIPVAGTSVAVTKVSGQPQKPRSQRTIRFDRAMSEAFTRAFDQTGTSPPGTCIGGIGPSISYRIDITSGAHTWQLSYPGSACEDIAVQRDGRQLNNVETNVQFRRMLRLAFLVNRGVVHGHLLAVGGPAGAHPAHLYGSVSLTAPRGASFHHRTNGIGGYSFSAPVGTYRLSGSSSHFKIDGRRGLCRAPHKVVVRANRATHVNIYCSRR